jgi:antitoxin ParD1/3/4
VVRKDWTMATVLPPDLLQFVEREIASGRYGSEDDVICEALRLLRERDERLEALRADIRPALEQLERGEGKPLDGDAIKARGRQRLAAKSENA